MVMVHLSIAALLHTAVGRFKKAPLNQHIAARFLRSWKQSWVRCMSLCLPCFVLACLRL
jgi:hypothetical protein